VVNVARGIHPDQPLASTWCRRPRRRSLRWTQLLACSHWCRSRCRSTRSRYRSRHSRRLIRSRSRRGRGSRGCRIPRLHALMPRTSSTLACRRRVRPILADPGRTRGRIRRSLRPRTARADCRDCNPSKFHHLPHLSAVLSLQLTA
jgi:hypothetical protein